MSNTNARRSSKLLIVVMAAGLGLVLSSCATDSESTTAPATAKTTAETTAATTIPEYECLNKAMADLRDCVQAGMATPANPGEYQVRNDCVLKLAANKTESCDDEAVKLAGHLR